MNVLENKDTDIEMVRFIPVMYISMSFSLHIGEVRMVSSWIETNLITYPLSFVYIFVDIGCKIVYHPLLTSKYIKRVNPRWQYFPMKGAIRVHIY